MAQDPYWVDDNGVATWAAAQSATPLSGASCASLATANSNVAAGDTVNMRGGDYSTRIEPAAGGGATNKITYQAYNNEAVVITGTPTGDGAVHLNGTDYIVIDGIHVSNCWRLVEIEGGSDYIEIRNSTFEKGQDGVGNSGVLIRDLGGTANNHIWFHNNTVFETGNIATNTCQDESNLMKVGTFGSDYATGNMTIESNIFYWGGHHILETYGSNIVVRANVFHNEGWMTTNAGHNCQPTLPADDNGLWGNRNFQLYDGNSRAALHCLVEDNRFGHASAPPDGNGAINLEITAPGNIIRYNFMFNAGEKNIHLKQASGADSENNRIYNNTCNKTRGQRPGADGIFFSEASDNNVVFNNIFYDSDGNDIGLKTDGNTVSNNWVTTDGNPQWTNNDLTDPTSSTLPDLTLQAASSLIDNGIRLTQANGAGTNSTALVVDDALFFQDGSWGSSLSNIQADHIALSTVDNTVQISSINYATETITLASAMTWADNADIWLYKKSDGAIVLQGSAPDQGAHEYVAAGAWWETHDGSTDGLRIE